MKQKTHKRGPTAQLPRRPYHSPTLSTYGAIRELTAGGSGRETENKGKDFQPTKRP
jgi:hypothetical protein